MPPTQAPAEQETGHREICPFCGSIDTTTTSKSPDADSYWRCLPCGQIWNAERVQPSSSSRFSLPRHSTFR